MAQEAHFLSGLNFFFIPNLWLRGGRRDTTEGASGCLELPPGIEREKTQAETTFHLETGVEISGHVKPKHMLVG